MKKGKKNPGTAKQERVAMHLQALYDEQYAISLGFHHGKLAALSSTSERGHESRMRIQLEWARKGIIR